MLASIVAENGPEKEKAMPENVRLLCLSLTCYHLLIVCWLMSIIYLCINLLSISMFILLSSYLFTFNLG